METNLDRLEDRVQRAAQRIHELSQERARLDGDVEELKRRLAAAERKRSAGRGAQEPKFQADAFASELQELIRELRDV
jgi:predicted  nucleic acid-binding Zn-ribbon protein